MTQDCGEDYTRMCCKALSIVPTVLFALSKRQLPGGSGEWKELNGGKGGLQQNFTASAKKDYAVQ